MNDGKKIVIVGGGIAGISCLEALIQEYNNSDDPPFKSITLVSEHCLVKKVVDLDLKGRNLESFNVIECDINTLFKSKLPEGLTFRTIIGKVEDVNGHDKILTYHNGNEIHRINYDILCLCNGSRPKELDVEQRQDAHKLKDKIIVIRDTTSVQDFKIKLKSCSRLVIVGNGGIGLELVSKINDCEKFWIIRDESIGLTFFDSGAGKFLLDSVDKGNHHKIDTKTKISRECYSADARQLAQGFGPALGPSWLQDTELVGKCDSSSSKLNIIYNDEVLDIQYNSSVENQLIVRTKAGKIIHCDLVASAIGVAPNRLLFSRGQVEYSEVDGGILVDEQMRTSVANIYAAGDVVSCDRWTTSELWFQMRLWTQARQMGHYTGRCIASHLTGQDPSVYFNFDCFTHCTSFFGFKFILLGKYNCQSFNDHEAKQCQVEVRVNPGKDYVKIIIREGKIIGAVLIGESGLEETIENLIHDQIDISDIKDQLLDETVDIEDYFD